MSIRLNYRIIHASSRGVTWSTLRTDNHHVGVGGRMNHGREVFLGFLLSLLILDFAMRCLPCSRILIKLLLRFGCSVLSHQRQLLKHLLAAHFITFLRNQIVRDVLGLEHVVAVGIDSQNFFLELSQLYLLLTECFFLFLCQILSLIKLLVPSWELLLARYSLFVFFL